MSPPILFLDIDGVMKPGRAYLDRSQANALDGGFDPLASAAVNMICFRTGAWIVFNSVWNNYGHDGLRMIAKREGITAPIHQDATTDFPIHIQDRMSAIRAWINEHPDTPVWAALDDCPMKSPFAILVDFENGISLDNYREATRLLGNEDKFVVVL